MLGNFNLYENNGHYDQRRVVKSIMKWLLWLKSGYPYHYKLGSYNLEEGVNSILRIGN